VSRVQGSGFKKSSRAGVLVFAIIPYRRFPAGGDQGLTTASFLNPLYLSINQARAIPNRIATAQVSEIAFNYEMRETCMNPAGSDQAPATASFLNPEP
jgi:hypothetical protein